MKQVRARHFAWRYYVVLTVFLMAALVVSGRLVFLQVEKKNFLQKQGDIRVVRVEVIPAYRGIIQDRNGEPLAVSTPVKTLWANPRELALQPEKWAALAKKLDQNEQALKKKILEYSNKVNAEGNPIKYMLLERNVSPAVANEILQMDIPGVNADDARRRYFPAGEVTAHLVGFTDIDDKGQEGIELAYEKQLAGTDGKKRVIKDLKRRTIKDVGLVNNAVPGKDVTLSIDLRAQYLAYRELLTAVKEYRAEAGTAVALDIETGEVLAMVNQPSYNPNNLAGGQPANRRNRALTDVFEPGSTVKPFTVAAALESGKWKVGSLVDTAPGYYRVGRKTIRDIGNYRTIDLATLLAKSSNVGAAKLGLSLEENALQAFFARMGLGQATGVGFPGESAGQLPVRWRPIEIATLSYGYGLSVTATQLTQAYAVLGSGGIRRPVSLLKVDGPVAGEQVVDRKIAMQVVRMMEGVTGPNGTAKRASVPGYRIAGKTGTVHKLSKTGYQDHEYLAVFAGVAPVENPRIALVVMIDGPKGDAYYGGLVAAPVFSRIMAGLLRVKNVPPDQTVENFVELAKKRLPES